MDALTIRRRFDSLDSLRKVTDDEYQDIETYIVPYSGEFFKPLSSEQEVDWRRPEIFDSTAPISADLLASKIHSGLTHPVIKWFKLAFRRTEMNESVEANQWLEEVETQVWQTIQESNFKTEIGQVHLDNVSYGTYTLFQEEVSDTEWEGTTFTSIPVRDSYFEYGVNDQVLRVYRRLQYTRIQLEDKWPDHDFTFLDKGEDGDKGPVDEKHTVVFCVYKRDEVTELKERMKPEARPWGYKYILHRNSEEIEEGGYYQMPAYVGRWKKVSGSRNGHSPGMICLSDIRQLNQTVAQVSEARAKDIDPPMKTTERGLLSDLELLPGGLTMVMEMDEVGPMLLPMRNESAELEINRLQENIRGNYYIDRLELKESPAMTAYETSVRLHRLLENFAPTLARYETDSLNHVIENTYHMLVRNKLVPPMPEVLGNVLDLDIEYIGPIPRALKNEEAQGTSMFLNETVSLSVQTKNPDIMDVVNMDKALKGLALARGVPAAYLNDKDEIAKIRDERNDRIQEMEEFQKLQMASKAAKDMGATEESPVSAVA